jgi:hypothetical protein
VSRTDYFQYPKEDQGIFGGRHSCMSHHRVQYHYLGKLHSICTSHRISIWKYGKENINISNCAWSPSSCSNLNPNLTKEKDSTVDAGKKKMHVSTFLRQYLSLFASINFMAQLLNEHVLFQLLDSEKQEVSMLIENCMHKFRKY